jgi:hypothetical protein
MYIDEGTNKLLKIKKTPVSQFSFNVKVTVLIFIVMWRGLKIKTPLHNLDKILWPKEVKSPITIN